MAITETTKTVTGARIKLMFERRGLARAAMAFKAGITRKTLREQLSKNFPRQRLRLVMETVADMPIWSEEQAFIRRKALTVRLGFDPWTVPAQQLRRMIPGLELAGWKGRWKRAQVIELLERKYLTGNKTENPKP